MDFIGDVHLEQRNTNISAFVTPFHAQFSIFGALWFEQVWNCFIAVVIDIRDAETAAHPAIRRETAPDFLLQRQFVCRDALALAVVACQLKL